MQTFPKNKSLDIKVEFDDLDYYEYDAEALGAAAAGAILLIIFALSFTAVGVWIYLR